MRVKCLVVPYGAAEGQYTVLMTLHPPLTSRSLSVAKCSKSHITLHLRHISLQVTTSLYHLSTPGYILGNSTNTPPKIYCVTASFYLRLNIQLSPEGSRLLRVRQGVTIVGNPSYKKIREDTLLCLPFLDGFISMKVLRMDFMRSAVHSNRVPQPNEE